MNTAKTIMIIFLVLDLLRLIKYDIDGRPAKKPLGFSGVITSFIATAVVAILWWFAGIFTFN